MLEIQNLQVEYNSQPAKTIALQDINISIAAGDINTFVGPSGCGKSTLLYVLSGIIKDYNGTIAWHGETIDPKKHRIGLILQNYGLLPWKNVRDNCLLGRKIKDGTAELDDYANEILRELGIDHLLHRYPAEISGGQQQRVAIARAFILKPDILLMDEPFSALDAISREEMQSMFLRLWQQNHVTTVFITHSIDEALYLGSKIVVFSSAPGKIKGIIDNPCFQAEDIRNNPAYFQMMSALRNILAKG